MGHPIPEHGTLAGYERHRRAQEESCELCKAAKRGYQVGMRRRLEREPGIPDDLTAALLAFCRAVVMRRPVPGIHAAAVRALRIADEPLTRNGAPICGTRTGYQAHKRKGEQVCDRCRAANSQATRDGRARKAAEKFPPRAA